MKKPINNSVNNKIGYIGLILAAVLIVGIITYITIPFPKFEQISVFKLGVFLKQKLKKLLPPIYK